MAEIKSKIHKYGHENESAWPPRFGNRKSGRSYWDAEKKCVVEGSPPYKYERYGKAPLAITPSMPAEYHEGVGRVIDDRNEWKMADEQSGSLTFGSRDDVKRSTERGVKDEAAALKRDRIKAREIAMGKYRSNPREVKQKVRKRREEQMATVKKNGLGEVLHDAGVKYDD
jgi:hypothetical protein